MSHPSHPYLLLFEGVIYLLFGVYFWHAARKGRFAVMELLWAALYGFLLEWITLKQLNAYHYGPFVLMIDGTPLPIALGWAVIIASSMEFSSRLELPESVQPVLDALLALNIDLVLDVIAVRLGMWIWNGVAQDQQWFGVPWANFYAWFIVVWSYSGFIRALRRWQGFGVRQWLYAPLAALLSLLVLTTASELYRVMVNTTGNDALPSILLISGSLVIVLASRPHHLPALSPAFLVTLTPIVFHSFAIVAGLANGIFSQQPILAVVAVTMLIIGLVVHGLSWWLELLHNRVKNADLSSP